MKKVCCCAFFALAMLMAPGFCTSAMSGARIQVNIKLPIPPLIFPAPPLLLPIPGAYVYYPPDVKTDMFFYHGRWYRPHAGRWYRAKSYNGPWHFIHGRQVPRAVIRVPHSYRTAGRHYEKIPYHQVQRNYRAWEKNHYWDRGKNHYWDRGKSQTYKQSRVEHHHQVQRNYRAWENNHYWDRENNHHWDRGKNQTYKQSRVEHHHQVQRNYQAWDKNQTYKQSGVEHHRQNNDRKHGNQKNDYRKSGHHN